MKKIGFIGGLGPTSTILFYSKLISEGQKRFGYNPEIIIHSVQLQQCLELLASQQYQELADIFDNAFRDLKSNGADILFLSSLSMHRVFPFCDNHLDNVVNLFSVIISEINEQKILILGTKYIVKNRYFLSQFKDAGKEIMVANEAEEDEVERIIKEELNHGLKKDKSRKFVNALIEKYTDDEDGVVLACTALPSLIKISEVTNKLYDPIDIGCREIISKV